MKEEKSQLEDSLYIDYMQRPMYKLKKKAKLKDMMPQEETTDEAKEKGVPYTDNDEQTYLYGARKSASDLRTSTVI